MKNKSQAYGVLGEQLACDFLVRKNYIIRERNYRVAGGEIDIIAQHNDVLIFVEVKTRNSSRYGYPEEAVDYRKIHKMTRAIRQYVRQFSREPLYRIDIIAVSLNQHMRQAHIQHIRNIDMSFENS